MIYIYIYAIEDAYILEFNEERIQYSLYHNVQTNNIKIEKIVDGAVEGWFYRGQCKSINELKKIMKWIGIHQKQNMYSQVVMTL